MKFSFSLILSNKSTYIVLNKKKSGYRHCLTAFLFIKNIEDFNFDHISVIIKRKIHYELISGRNI